MLKRIKVNIITGFLGVGKTTAIQHLLASKPVDENWVVLVNEFGEVGLDQQFFQQQSTVDNKLTIKQVAGGCMCCTQGPATRVVLNQIIRQLAPDRLFIEPSGLGHPKEVLDTLMSDQYRDWLDCRSSITLVDPRHFSDSRYTEHAIFNQQCQIADVIVANKHDLQTVDDIAAMREYLVQRGLQDKPVFFIERGELKPAWLDAPASFLVEEGKPELDLTKMLFRPVKHQHYSQPKNDSDWHSVGFRYDENTVFDQQKLLDWCSQSTMARVKLAVNCEQQTSILINAVASELDSVVLNQTMAVSQIELIDDKPILESEIEQQLAQCLLL